MQQWIFHIMSRYGYMGIAGLIGIENLFPPIPSEVILTFGGFMTTCTDLCFTGVVLAATLGSLIGAIILYSLGYLLSYEKLCRILSGRTGRILHLYPSDIEKAVVKFNQKGNYTVFFCRFIPIVRSLISIPAGCAKMKLLPFLVLTALGSFLWNTVLVYLGALAGKSWQRIAAYMGTYSSLVLVVLLTALLCALLFRIKSAADSKKQSH
jgi:alkaline phosphatase